MSTTKHLQLKRNKDIFATKDEALAYIKNNLVNDCLVGEPIIATYSASTGTIIPLFGIVYADANGTKKMYVNEGTKVNGSDSVNITTDSEGNLIAKVNIDTTLLGNSISSTTKGIYAPSVKFLDTKSIDFSSSTDADGYLNVSGEVIVSTASTNSISSSTEGLFVAKTNYSNSKSVTLLSASETDGSISVSGDVNVSTALTGSNAITVKDDGIFASLTKYAATGETNNVSFSSETGSDGYISVSGDVSVFDCGTY